MAERLDFEVRNFLRPSEEVKIALDTLTVQRDGGNDVGQASPSPDWKRRRVLAVVTHRNQSENQEGRCVQVLCSGWVCNMPRRPTCERSCYKFYGNSHSTDANPISFSFSVYSYSNTVPMRPDNLAWKCSAYTRSSVILPYQWHKRSDPRML